MNKTYRVPSKTFIVGEYNVIYGGNGVLLATKPDFLVNIVGNQFHKPIDYLDFSENREDIKISGGEAGFGSSSAGFLSLYKFVNGSIDLSKMLLFYKSIATSKIKPSGADIVTQLLGKITLFAGSKSSTLNWDFSNYEILIFKTKTKIQTYKHLNSDFNLTSQDLLLLQEEVGKVIDGINYCNIENLSNGINNYQKILLKKNLVSEQTQNIMDEVSKINEVIAFKGCGALCNDAIITLNLKMNSDIIVKKLRELGLRYIASTGDVIGGINVVC